jgi:hypothetical protein
MRSSAVAIELRLRLARAGQATTVTYLISAAVDHNVLAAADLFD